MPVEEIICKSKHDNGAKVLAEFSTNIICTSAMSSLFTVHIGDKGDGLVFLTGIK